jgi:LPS export ABC transporter protein LptC
VKVPLLVGLGAAVVLGGVFLLGREGTAPGAPASGGAEQPDMGYVADEARVVQTSDNGSPLYTLTAERIEREPESGRVQGHTIAMRYRERLDNDPTGLGQLWTLTAREGELPGDSSRIHLTGDVLVTGQFPDSPAPAEIRTQALDYDTVSQDLGTKMPVTITWGNQRITARGLSANLKQDNLRLESAVHGRFSP